MKNILKLIKLKKVINMNKTTAERINSIANKYNVSYNVIKLFIYSDYGNKIIDENEKLNILEKL